jgi:hypothetical protein
MGRSIRLVCAYISWAGERACVGMGTQGKEGLVVVMEVL